ncbi:helix-turn-helix domain-containing protein [Pyxidicoccus xibeiensis]|uniref:helix-turn-helix domain-containing protein n=1 Tax=Pyxidicoccus xibeiensis TaxID=2906759 RepID=UPI0020A79B56|nr:helix-turn-helix domain-containing protein [Pyxidicoccus xibeiensis]MCP3144442.1 helix-turn-helix domain-containing protein [Pyxidicoccus xibeiensis]
MKPFEQQTYYELLEVPVSAPVDDIRAAYSRLMELYSPDSIAVYALVDPEQVDTLRARMTEAMEILTDADLRAEYDKDLGLPAVRMAEAVAAGGRPSSEARAGAGAVARAAEALASTAVEVRAEAPARDAAVASTQTPASEAPAPAQEGQVDFRSRFFRGFSFAYVSSSLEVSPLVGSAVDVSSPARAPTASPASPVVEAVAAAPSPVTPVPEAAAPAPAPLPTSPVVEAVAAAPSPVTPVPEAAAPAPTPLPVAPVAEAASPAPAAASAPPAAPKPDAPAAVPARPESTPSTPSLAGPPPLPGTRAAVLRATAEARAAARATAPDSQAPRPASGRQLGDAQILSQDSAIATAESALAQVAARVREPRPRTPDIPSDAEFNGELLRRVREARGFSLQQVADRTRITRSHLENVEADRYSALPPPVYLRGILMNLARELGLDPLRVSRSYLALASEKSGKK